MEIIISKLMIMIVEVGVGKTIPRIVETGKTIVVKIIVDKIIKIDKTQ